WRGEGRYTLTVVDATTGAEIGRALPQQQTKPGHGWAVVRFWPQARHTYQVRVHALGEPAGEFHLVALGGGLDCATARGSIACPADGPAVIAVRAVDAWGQRVGYSACGPNSRRPKPDLVAPVPFPSRWRPQPFTGTSAAAPQAAALAALWWSRHPDWTAA